MNGYINQAIMDLGAKDQKRLDAINHKLYKGEFKEVADYKKAIEDNTIIFREEIAELLDVKPEA